MTHVTTQEVPRGVDKVSMTLKGAHAKVSTKEGPEMV